MPNLLAQRSAGFEVHQVCFFSIFLLCIGFFLVSIFSNMACLYMQTIVRILPTSSPKCQPVERLMSSYFSSFCVCMNYIICVWDEPFFVNIVRALL
jgi:hypothetical protein